MSPILFGSGKAEGLTPLPSGKVGAYCIRPLILLAKGGKALEALFPIRVGRGLGGTFLSPILFGGRKAEGSIFLSVEWVGLQKYPPLALLAKGGKAQGSLFPIRVG